MDRFMYHALTFGLSGRIERPFDEIIPAQASIALPETGGFGTSRVENFRFHDIVSFASATSVVSGSFSDQDGGSRNALATVTIEGLNVLGVVTAERIVARIKSTHPVDTSKPRSLSPLGSYIENLRIGGCLIEPDLATDTFAKFDNADKIRAAYESNQDGFRDEFNTLALVGQSKDVPEKIRDHFQWLKTNPADAFKEFRGVVTCPLVRGLLRDVGLPVYGNVIPFRGFGIIRLPEVKITSSGIQILMLQIEMGSTPEGQLAAGGGEGNGQPWEG
jgi:hypothetical protein